MNNNEKEEKRVVVLSNAVIDPWAVMIEPLNAPVAVAAVKTARCPNHATLGAHLCCVHSTQDSYKVHVWVPFEVTWIL